MNKVAPIFKDSSLQKQFEGDGYVKIKLLDRLKAQQLYNYYMANQKEHDVIEGLYHSTTHTNNPDLILQVDTYLKKALLPELHRYFINYEPMLCTYITKVPGEGSETRLHQDPTFVDEAKYISANVWVALHDIDHQNGNLFFVKGTHRMVSGLRVTPDYPTEYDKVKGLLHENLTEVPVKAGEAIIINHATVHGATPNLANELRIAAVMAIRSVASDWIYHYLEPGASYDKIEKYSVDLDAFINLKKDGRPDQKGFLGYVSADFPQLSPQQFRRKMREVNSSGSSLPWLSTLSNIKEKLFS
jgi:hypothetical protein